MNELYIIVHASEDMLKQDKIVSDEINRIKKEEQFVEVNENPCVVNYHIPECSKIYVCGFYHGKEKWDHRCVDEQIKALKRKGYHPELYLKATISLDP